MVQKCWLRKDPMATVLLTFLQTWENFPSNHSWSKQIQHIHEIKFVVVPTKIFVIKPLFTHWKWNMDKNFGLKFHLPCKYQVHKLQIFLFKSLHVKRWPFWLLNLQSLQKTKMYFYNFSMCIDEFQKCFFYTTLKHFLAKIGRTSLYSILIR